MTPTNTGFYWVTGKAGVVSIAHVLIDFDGSTIQVRMFGDKSRGRKTILDEGWSYASECVQPSEA